jgi:hypothetical protein
MRRATFLSTSSPQWPTAVCDIAKYKFALMTDSHAGYKELRELLVKNDLNAGHNQKLKSFATKTQSQYKPSIQYTRIKNP